MRISWNSSSGCICTRCWWQVWSTSSPPLTSVLASSSPTSSQPTPRSRSLWCSASCSAVWGGLVVAAILKKLDNVVKDYSYATSNMFTALISALLFPDKFQITVFILLAMGLLFLGIYLYEKKSLKPPPSEPASASYSLERTSDLAF